MGGLIHWSYDRLKNYLPSFTESFFGCFFDAKFSLQFGRAKNRKKRPTRGGGDFLKAGSAVCAGLGGRI